MASLAMVFDEVVGLLSEFRLDSLESGIGVSGDVEDFSSSWVIDSDFSLELSLEMCKQGVVKFVVLGELSLNFSAVVGGQEILEVVQLVCVCLVLQSINGSFVQDDTLFEEEQTGEHESVTSVVEDVSLLGQVSQLSASVHDEDDDFLLMDITLSSLRNNSLLFTLTLRGFVSVNILHVELDVEWVDKLDFILSIIGLSVLLEQFSDLVLSVSEHHRSKIGLKKKNFHLELTVSCQLVAFVLGRAYRITYG